MPHFSILTLIKIEIQFKVAFQSSNFLFFLLQLPPCTAVVQIHRMTPKSGFVLRLKLDLFEILPLDLFTGDSPVKIHSSVHTCPGLDKLTGFKFTRVSFWHMFFDHHEDRSDLPRSVCGLKFVLVEFRSSLRSWRRGRMRLKTASLASSDRFSSTGGDDRTQDVSSENQSCWTLYL